MTAVIYRVNNGEIVGFGDMSPQDFGEGFAAIAPNEGFDAADLKDWVVLAGALQRRPVTAGDIDAELARRVMLGVSHRGYVFQLDPVSQGNITAMSLRADRGMRDPLIGPLSLRWSRPDHDAHWIAADNTRVPMTAQQMIEFGEAAADHIEALRFAARDLKDMNPIPADYAADFHWP